MSEIARLGRWPATHVDPAAVALRSVLLASGISAWLFTSVASHRLAGGMGFVIVALTARCARYPDGHAGLLVVAAVTIDWLATLHDHATPWSMATAAALALLHSTAAAASVAPTGASWTVAMRRRWARRSLLLVATGAWPGWSWRRRTARVPAAVPCSWSSPSSSSPSAGCGYGSGPTWVHRPTAERVRVV